MNIPALLSINWNPDSELLNLFGSIPIHYYGLLQVVGIAPACAVVYHQYHDRKADEKTLELLFFYCFFGILIGTRLGHCLFYQPNYYLSRFQEMILPVKFLPGGDWKRTGYEGLASHDGTLGLIIFLRIYCCKTKMHCMDVLDMTAVATSITACYICLTNLMNSEIIGMPTSVPWAFTFERVNIPPHHPTQLYEAIAYFIFFLGMVYLYKRGQKKRESKSETGFNTIKTKSTTMQAVASLLYHRGLSFGLCLTEVFAFRFFIGFLKEDQVDFEKTMVLNVGQWPSVPLIFVRIYFMCFCGKKMAGK